MKFWRWCSHST